MSTPSSRRPAGARPPRALRVAVLAAVPLLVGTACRTLRPARPAAELRTGPPIPITIFRDRYVFCPGRVNGHGTEMLVDSGAGVTILSSAFAAELGLDGQSDHNRIMGIGGRQSARWGSGVVL